MHPDGELGEPDESGRGAHRNESEGSEFKIEADHVILAIGQGVDKEAFAESLGYSESGNDLRRSGHAETTVEGVFAGGDRGLRASDVISAVGAGQQAATSIELYLAGIDLVKGRPGP